MADRIPLAEQLDEVRAEYTRRCQAYPLLVARGQMRQGAMEFKIARMAATHNTLAWLLRNADQIREWVQYTQKVAPKDEREQVVFDAPPDVLPGGIDDDGSTTDEDEEAKIHPDEGAAGGGTGLPVAAE